MRLVEDSPQRAEGEVRLPSGSGERFAGWGVMGLPFTSGHVLALRRFSASSIGPGYTTVWHRTPGGAWTMYTDELPEHTCPRYFSRAVARTVATPIDIYWSSARTFRVTTHEGSVDWYVEISRTVATRIMTAMGALMPARLWRSPAILSLMQPVAGRVLGVGRVGLHGRAPNGQWFAVNPRRLWVVADSHATVNGEDVGVPGPLAEQASLGDFWIPQRGIVAVGEAVFEAGEGLEARSAG